ncbi:hypothetical protein [Inquilinus limosus]|uniref:hypothetical protein n=1 Tax=Inquilinus limosus TaxID=171674 RepID=UPI0004183119|nr:hypothetical protein [Inquilinus limosus]
MRNRFHALLGVATLAIGLTAAASVFAQGQQAPAQPPAAPDHPMGGMMQGQQGDGMMPMMKMMTQMSEMMENCNKMMQSKVQDQGMAPQKQGG